VGQADTATFEGKNVLLAYSKDNHLIWIKDWISYYAKAHGVNAVLFYDNGSIAYSNRELLETIQSIAGIDATILVRWPFLHGPVLEQPGVNSDGSYSQVAMLTHAREKFLTKARAVISCDVDELIYSYTGESLCDAVAASKDGHIKVAGTWIESVTNSISAPHRHLDYRHIDPAMPSPKSKWASAPLILSLHRSWWVHGYSTSTPDPRFHYAHFRGISLNWKTAAIKQRGRPSPPQANHQLFPEIDEFITPYFTQTADISSLKNSRGKENLPPSSINPARSLAAIRNFFRAMKKKGPRG
jgi:hypothetical protein